MQLVMIWLVSLMLSMQPSLPVGSEPYETLSQREQRYSSIVEDVLTVTYDPEERPLVSGPRGRLESALIVLASAYDETRWRPGVETLEGHAALARHGLVDGGRSYCMMQVHLGPRGKTREGWTGADLLDDRTKCIRAGYHVMQRAFGACWRLPKLERLAAYVSGGCDIGRERSRSRLAMAQRWMQRAPSIADAELMPRAWDPLAMADGF